MGEIGATDDVWNGLIDLLPIGLTISHYPSDNPADGYLVAANPAASAILGFDLSEFIGVVQATEGVDERFDEAEVSESTRMGFDVAVGGSAKLLDNFIVEHGPGRGNYQSRIFPLPGRRAASVFRRIDREVAASQALDWAMASLETANQSLSSFASTIAHDLKNPLSGIAGNAELVKMMSTGLPDEASSALDRVIELSTTSSAMVDGLLRYSKAPTTHATGGVNLRDVVAWAANLLAEEIDSAEATVSIDGDATAVGNEAALRQVMLNLLSNSLSYRRPDRRLRVKVEIEAVENRVILRLTDNGAGIAVEMRGRVFDWGVRNDTDGAAPTGSGLGLAASRAVLGSLGGAIEIAESGDHGTVMLVTLLAKN